MQTTTNTKMITIIAGAIDWTSVKLTSLCSVLLFINVGQFLQWAGALSVLSTLIYNGIRIYKELKNKKQ